MARTSIQQYGKGTVNSLTDADPHTQVAAIMAHILGNVAAARGAIERKDFEVKGLKIGKAIELLTVLQASLDMEVGGEISRNLFDLYDFCIFKLGEGSVSGDLEALDAVTGVMRNIKEGWDGIPQDVRDDLAQKKAAEGG
ncbi:MULTISPECIES: flagellar export chaperone FliS [Corallincola]|uniref:Flagellar secretion chaperone FliS n=3 Tax=Corallincola TaxID=1775176 RepID=A0A368N4X7_9GAMM|nr:MULTISPECIES: flagellar export chaperone FliS [Corallincola]RCU44575.1 flagellar export chaperone FliS [Corallincola holothuriorum]TAA40320.1 flagellar export chaperone FliS [Corallincola spongiicola]TCI05373.1 flagellar export chaperone FliS [Corallincola luteus]